MSASNLDNNTILTYLTSAIKTESEDEDFLIQPDSEYGSAAAAIASSQSSSSSLNDIDYYVNDATLIAQNILNLLKIKEDKKALQTTLVALGIFLIVLGILMNTLFNMFTIIRRRYTTQNVIMVSMCTSYLLYLIFYCLKLSVYLKDISKYHIYDTLQEWDYGLFLCQFINGLLLTCKLVSRFSILALCVKRIVTLFQAKNEDEDYLGNKTQQSDQHQQDGLQSSASTISLQSKALKIFAKIFDWPLLLLLILFIWLISFLISLPVYLSYKITTENSTTLCDSIYTFPDEISKYALSTLNYMIFALILPSILILMAIGIIFALQCVYDLSLNEKIKSQTNWLLVIIFLIHLVTTLPTEIYKYNRLNMIKHQNEEQNVLLEIEKAIKNPLADARPYYYLQYLYISEFIIMPIVFLIFYILSTKKISNICTLYIKCFDCHEKEELLNKRKKAYNHEKNLTIDDINQNLHSEYDDAVVTATNVNRHLHHFQQHHNTDSHMVTKSLLNDDKIDEKDEFNEDNVKITTGSGRIKIIRKTSAASSAGSTNTTSSGSAVITTDLPQTALPANKNYHKSSVSSEASASSNRPLNFKD